MKNRKLKWNAKKCFKNLGTLAAYIATAVLVIWLLLSWMEVLVVSDNAVENKSTEYSKYNAIKIIFDIDKEMN